MSEPDSSTCLQPILRNLEAIQVEIGKAQLALLDLLVDSDAEECDDVTRTALIRLESIQRSVGEVQVMLFREVAGGESTLAEPDSPPGADLPPVTLVVAPQQVSQPEALEAPIERVKVAQTPPSFGTTELRATPIANSLGVENATAIPPSSPSGRSTSPVAPQGHKPGILSSAGSPAPRPSAAAPMPASIDPPPVIVVPPVTTSGETFLASWLAARGCRIKELRQPSGLDAAAEEIALFLGQHYADLEAPYGALRGLLNPRRTSKWLQTGDWPPAVISVAAQFGRKLKDNGFLAQFVYVSKNKTMLCEPVSDPRVLNFLDGGWLERWAAHVMRTVITQKMGSWHDERLLQGVQIELPNRTEAELDVLANPHGETVFWLECKAGNWQSDLRRYYDLNQQHFHLPDSQASLVLVDRVKDAGRASAGELSSMTILHLTELAEWLDQMITALD